MKILILNIYLILPFFVYSQNNKMITSWQTQGFDIYFESISKKDFTANDGCFVSYDFENKIEKKNSMYCIELENKTIILKDIFEEDDPSYTHYKYLYSIADFLYFGVGYYEISTTLLINKETGTSTEFYGKIFFSQDFNFIFCASQIMNYEPFPNDIRVYKVINGQIRLIAEYRLDGWYPDNVKWVNVNTVIFEQRFENNNIRYMMMKINQ